MSEYSKFWDEKIKPLAQEIIEKATVDKEMLNHYVGGMIWAVEHDLADGRGKGVNSLNALITVKDTLSSQSYYDNVHPNTSIEEKYRLRKLSDLINEAL